MRATRRGAIGGAIAGTLTLPSLPVLARPPSARSSSAGASIMLHDPALVAGQRFAAAATARGGDVRTIGGDRIRFAQAVLHRRPALIAGISRHADALLIEDVAREAGYTLVASVDARDGLCLRGYSRPGWSKLVGFAGRAGENWPEALAAYAAQAEAVAVPAAAAGGQADKGLVLGWVLAPAA